MRLPSATTPSQTATWQGRPIRFGLHTTLTHAGSSVPFREPWSYLRYWIRDNYPPSSIDDALQLAKQSEHFYRVALEATSDTSPLLWYYSFLNLAKVLLLKTPGVYTLNEVEHATHGIVDPADNSDGYVKLSKQQVTIYPVRTTRMPPKLQVFPALCEALRTPIAFAGGANSKSLAIKSLLSHIVCVHRAYSTAYGAPLKFCKTDVTANEQRSESGKSGKIWHAITVESIDVKATGAAVKGFEINNKLRAVAPKEKGVHLFETPTADFSNVNFIVRLATLRADLRPFVHPLLLPQGYRYYLYPGTGILRQPCSIYAVMFYLGSIVRYKPQRFASLVGNKYHWLIEEFLQVAPKQFVALVINEITDCELPYFLE